MPLTMTVRLEGCCDCCGTVAPPFTLRGGADFQRGSEGSGLGALMVSVLRADGWHLPRSGEHRCPGCAAAAGPHGPLLARNAWKLLADDQPWPAVIRALEALLPGVRWTAASISALLISSYEELPVGTPKLSRADRELPGYSGETGRSVARPRQTSAA